MGIAGGIGPFGSIGLLFAGEGERMILPYYKEVIVSTKDREEFQEALRRVSIEAGTGKRYSPNILFRGKISDVGFELKPLPGLNYGIKNSLVPRIYGTFEQKDKNQKAMIKIVVKPTVIWWVWIGIATLVCISALVREEELYLCIGGYFAALCIAELSFWIPCNKSMAEIKKIM